MRLATRGLLLTAMLLLAACGGGADTAATPPQPSAQCDPADPATFAECGTVMVALTDADGDFLNYTVDVLSLTLETANGRIIETLPQRSRINFTDYVDLSELVTIATIPPGTYVSGTIRLDYGGAEVFVEASGEAKAAIVTGIDGNALGETALRIVLSDRDQLVVRRGLPSLLQLDFDLDASHTVDIETSPATAVAEPFILAEIVPVDEKALRVRGPLVSVDESTMTYTADLRPFHERDGAFGEVTIHVTDATHFEVNEDLYVGLDGLRALEASGAGTPTVAMGTLDVAAREFTADLVLAGSSVPGIEFDAVVGNVIRRDENLLTVRGATILQSDRDAHFHDDVVVEVGPDTKVYRDGYRHRDLGVAAISIGQRVTIRGIQALPTTDATAPQVVFDATQGAVRMHVTRLAGIVNTVTPGQVDLTLHAIDRRRVAIFDFTGTGINPDLDADPANYEVLTGNLLLSDFAAGRPIVARGFPNRFGEAPPDFVGRTIIDYTGVRSALGVGWGTAGTAAPFALIGSDRLVLDNDNPDTDVRHHIKQGPVLIDLATLGSDTTIVPATGIRTVYYVKTADSLRIYSDFADFVADLSASLDGTTAARSLHARGLYDQDSNLFTAYKIGIHLLAP
ncbi:MAG TPA: hypothetical protein VIS31_06305 [Woeseiaceae bacterium]